MNEDDVPVLQPPSELTQATVPLFERVTSAYHEGAPSGLVLDLSDVKFISSAGLSHLVAVGRLLDERGSSLALAAAKRRVLRLIQVVGLDQVLPHFATVEEASAYVRQQQGRSD